MRQSTMQFVVRRSDILGGEPVIVGTRIPAARLSVLVRHGYTEERLRAEFPKLGVRKLRGALAELLEAGLRQTEA